MQAEEARNAMGQTNSAPLGLRIGFTFGKMMVHAGQVSRNAIYVAGQLADRTHSAQIYSEENHHCLRGHRVQEG